MEKSNETDLSASAGDPAAAHVNVPQGKTEPDPGTMLDTDAPDAPNASDEDWLHQLTPREIVAELDKYIVGQDEAKKAVAIALRNRWRRQRVEEELREEILPNNLILIGPTGVGCVSERRSERSDPQSQRNSESLPFELQSFSPTTTLPRSSTLRVWLGFTRPVDGRLRGPLDASRIWNRPGARPCARRAAISADQTSPK